MMIHCTMDELLAIRDGEGSQAASGHLDGCDECRHELDMLHQRVAAIKAIPSLRPPRDRWMVVRENVLARRPRKWRSVTGWIAAAAAASVVFTLGLGRLAFSAAQQPDPMTELVWEAQELEDALRTMQLERRVMSGRTAYAVAMLEDRLVALDQVQRSRMSRDQLIRLLQERVNLMDALVNVRAAPVTYIGF